MTKTYAAPVRITSSTVIEARIKHYIESMPIGDVGYFGDFAQPGGLYDEVSRKLVSRPAQIEKLRTLVRSSYKINIYFWNVLSAWFHNQPDSTHPWYGDRVPGSVGDDDITRVMTAAEFNKWAAKLKPPARIVEDPSAVTVVMLGNQEGKEPLSPWMIIHRAAHAFVEPKHFTDWQVVKEFQNFCMKYHSSLKKYGTSRSFRTAYFDKEGLDDEVMVELFTQYLVAGKITLGDGHVGKAVAKVLNELAEAVAQQMVGKVIVTL